MQCIKHISFEIILFISYKNLSLASPSTLVLHNLAITVFKFISIYTLLWKVSSIQNWDLNNVKMRLIFICILYYFTVCDCIDEKNNTGHSEGTENR